MRVNAGAKIPMIQLSLDSIAQKALDNNKLLIMRLARVESITLASEPPNGAVTLPVEGGQFLFCLLQILLMLKQKKLG